MLNKEQLMYLNAGVTEALSLSNRGITSERQREIRIGVIGLLVNRKIESTKELEYREFRELRDKIYPNWSMGDWGISPEFKETVRELASLNFGVDYEENGS